MKLLNTSSREVVLSRSSSSDTQTIVEPACLQSWCFQIYLPHYCGVFFLKDSLTWSLLSFIYFNNVKYVHVKVCHLKLFNDLVTTYLFSCCYQTLTLTSPNQTLLHYDCVSVITWNFLKPSMPLFILYPYPIYINPALDTSSKSLRFSLVPGSLPW